MTTHRFAIPALLIVCFFWGTTYLALRIGVHRFPAFLFTGLRMMASGAIMGGIWMIRKKTFHVTWQSIWMNSLAGILFFALGIGMVGWAEKYIPSGLAAMICSLPPVWVVLLNIGIFRLEKLNFLIFCGILMGFGGILLVFYEHLQELLNPEYRLAVLVTVLANLGWVLASLLVKKRKPSPDSVFNATLQMLSGGIILLVFSLVAERKEAIVWTQPVVYSMLYLIFFGSLLAFWAYLFALEHLPITLVSMHTYANVLVAIVLGFLILHEKLNPLIFLAVCITLSGIYLVNKGLAKNTATSKG